MSRRAIAVILGSLALIGLVAGWRARFVSPIRTRVTQVIMPLPRRHGHLDGITIAFVSDTHIGPHFRTDDLHPTIAALRKLHPDVLILGGDYVSESPRFIDPSISALADIAAAARYGTWAILGNHDIANTRERIEEALGKANIPVLANASAEVVTEKGALWLTGIDDAILGKPDLIGAFQSVPADAATIALWHEPDRAEEVVPFDPIFMLAGHTHGGQVRIPGIGPIAAPKLGERYVLGRYDVDGMPLYVSSGVGMYRPPVRFNCPPEVLVITLLGDDS
jgi:predicted MPP superfamily phosphohydrolase